MPRSKKNVPSFVASVSHVEWWRVVTSEGVFHIPAGAFDGRPSSEQLRDDLTTPYANCSVAACSENVVVEPRWRKVKGWAAYHEDGQPPLAGPFTTEALAKQHLRDAHGVDLE